MSRNEQNHPSLGQNLRSFEIFVSSPRSNIRIAVGMICGAAVVFLMLATSDAAPQKYKYKQKYAATLRYVLVFM